MLILRSPIDPDRLKVAIGDVDTVQFDEPLTDPEYRLLASALERHPRVTMRAYGFHDELAGLGFLRHFPKLRRFSITGLFGITNVTPLNVLPDDLELLDLGQTRRPLDLRPLRFKKLHRLHVSGHTRGLDGLLARNAQLRALHLASLKVDRVLSDPSVVPRLEQLHIRLGSAQDLSWLVPLPRLRALSLHQVRGVDDTSLENVGRLSELQWLWLDTLARVTTLPALSRCRALTRIDLDGLRNMLGNDALAGLALAPELRELSITSAKLPLAALLPLKKHRALSAATIGLGSAKRNREAQDLLELPPADSALAVASAYAV